MNLRPLVPAAVLIGVILVSASCDRGSAGVLVTRTPGTPAASISPPEPTARASSTLESETATGAHTWYTSASKSGKDYYCDLDSGWRRIVAPNLRTYPTEQALLADWPGSRVKVANSKC